MGLTIGDTFVRKILEPGLPALLGLLMLPGCVAFYIAVKTVWLGDQESELTLSLVEFYSIKGLPADTTKTLLACIPAAVMAVCFRGTENEELTLPGKVSLLILLVGGGVSLAAGAYLNPADQNQVFNISGGADALRAVQAGADSSMRAALTYGLLLFGLKIGTTK